MTTMIWRLLSKNISVVQILGYAVASIIGLTLVLCAINFYQDASPAVKGNDFGKDYFVLSRSVSMLSTLGIGGGGISGEDIENLRRQPWVEDVGEFTSAEFGVSASVNLAGHSMWTYLFLESVPDEFLDVVPDGWGFDASNPQAEVPVIISREYLALYNFGFAASRGLPRLSEELITQIPLELYVNGNGSSAHFTARIAGFSNRLNTIAVPEAFVRWANEEFGSEPGLTSRLVVKLSDPGDPHIRQYLDANGYEVAGEGLRDNKVHFMLTLLSTVVGVVGIVICALALFIIMLNITLLMQKNKDKNHGLLMLGYSPASVEACYVKFVLATNAAVLVISIALMLVLSGIWQRVLAQAGIEGGSCLVAIVEGVVIMAVTTLVNYLSIRRSVRRSFCKSWRTEGGTIRS